MIGLLCYGLDQHEYTARVSPISLAADRIGVLCYELDQLEYMALSIPFCRSGRDLFLEKNTKARNQRKNRGWGCGGGSTAIRFSWAGV